MENGYVGRMIRQMRSRNYMPYQPRTLLRVVAAEDERFSQSGPGAAVLMH